MPHQTTITYIVLNFFPDQRTNEWPMVQGITTPLACVSVYLYLVLYLGPKFMENRKPFHLLPIIKVYNLVQLVACILIFYMVSIILNSFHLLQYIIYYLNINYMHIYNTIFIFRF